MPVQIYQCIYCRKPRFKGLILLKMHHDKFHKGMPWPQVKKTPEQVVADYEESQRVKDAN